MANDNEIIITIEDKTGGDGTGDGGGRKKKPKIPSSVPQLLSMWTDNDLIKEAIKDLYQMGMMQLNFSLNNIGNFTGNYTQQHNVQATVGFVKKGVSVGFSAAQNIGMGAAVGGWVGAIVGAVKTVAGIGIDFYQRHIQEEQILIQNRLANIDINLLRDRAGLNQLEDGSRGTQG